MAQFSAPWEEFPDLWNKPASEDIFSTLRKLEYDKQQKLYSQIAEQRMQDTIKQRAAADAIATLYRDNPGITAEQSYPKMRDIYGQAGDLEGILNLDKEHRQIQQDTQQQQDHELTALTQLAQLNPELAAQYYEHSGLKERYPGLGADAFTKQHKPDIRGGLKDGLWTVGDDGRVQILREPKGDSEKEYAPQIKEYVDPEGKVHQVNTNNLPEVRDAETKGWVQYRNKDPFDSLIQSMTGEEEAAPEDSSPGMVRSLLDYGSSFLDSFYKDKPQAVAGPKEATPQPPKAQESVIVKKVRKRIGTSVGM